MSSGVGRHVVEDADGGLRLDQWIVRRWSGVSRARARAFIAEGHVRVEGRLEPPGRRLRAGETIEIDEIPRPARVPATPDPELPLRVLWYDEHVVVVDKPAGVPSHPLRASERGTLAGALVARFPEMATIGRDPREPGLVHRLDTGTSGLLLAARSEHAFDHLTAALRGGRIEKQYVAQVVGAPAVPDVVRWPLVADRTDRRRVVACPTQAEALRRGARDAETHLLASYPAEGGVYLLVRAARAFRHQIRAHLAAMGHPLVGDELYGGPAIEPAGTHRLHACRIAFEHPVDGRLVSVVSRPVWLPDAAARALGLDDSPGIAHGGPPRSTRRARPRSARAGGQPGSRPRERDETDAIRTERADRPGR